MTTAKEDITDRLYTPTAEEADEYKRLFLTCENARKTLLEKKTQTRRIIDDVPDAADRVEVESEHHPAKSMYEHRDGGTVYVISQEYHPGEMRLVTTPHWRAHSGTEKDRIWDAATGVVRFSDSTPNGPNAICIPEREGWHPSQDTEYDWHQINASWLMPTWASRIAVEVTDVWYERIQEISGEDIAAEGITPEDLEREAEGRVLSDFTTERAFRALWEDIHGPGAWERNDWVRCIEYELITERS